MRVLVTDPIASDGIEFLKQRASVDVRLGLQPEELRATIADYEALVVRSETKVTAQVIEAGNRLQAIGRAGVGVDNIDVDAATRRGIVVVNAPAGNTIAAAEHTVALMLALARHIPQADASLRQGQWQRSRFMGVEIRGKVLGIVGLGRIGTEVGRRAAGLEMRLLGYDPYVPAEHAQRLGVELVDLNTLLSQSDFVTLHVPATSQTANIIGEKEIRQTKRGSFLINCARGGVVDEAALLTALDDGHLAGAALDVFETEPATDNPLCRHPRVVCTPHLGASTREAQVNVSLQVAEQVMAVLTDRPALYAVNAPVILPETASLLSPYLKLAETLGNLCTQLADGQFKGVEVTYSGEIAEYDTAALKASVIRGLLSPICDEPINIVNAPVVARSRDLSVSERKSTEAQTFTNLITVVLTTDCARFTVAGTLVNNEAHVVRIHEYSVDLVPSGGYVLMTHHRDRPGIIGKVGTILGEADINISSMQVGRIERRGAALMALSVDEPIPPEVLERIAAVPNIGSIKVVRL